MSKKSFSIVKRGISSIRYSSCYTTIDIQHKTLFLQRRYAIHTHRCNSSFKQPSSGRSPQKDSLRIRWNIFNNCLVEFVLFIYIYHHISIVDSVFIYKTILIRGYYSDKSIVNLYKKSLKKRFKQQIEQQVHWFLWVGPLQQLQVEPLQQLWVESPWLWQVGFPQLTL